MREVGFCEGGPGGPGKSAGCTHVHMIAWPVRGVCIPPPNLLSHPDHLSKIEGLDSVRLDLGGPGIIRFAVILLSFCAACCHFLLGGDYDILPDLGKG